MKLLLFTLFIVATATASAQWYPTPSDVIEWFQGGGIEVNLREPLPQLRNKFLVRATQWATEALASPAKLLEAVGGKVSSMIGSPDPKQDPYFGFIPPYAASVVPDGPAVTWTSGPCFQNAVAQAATQPDGNISIVVEFSKPVSLFCSDMYLIGTTAGIQLKTFFFHGTHQVTWVVPAKLAPEDAWDLKNKGIRFFYFTEGLMTTVGEVLDTLMMFEPETTKPVGPTAAEVNVDFMKKYRGVAMLPRTITDVDIDPALVHDGDFFGIIRLDGLDPMLGWAMGSTTGHTTTALHINGTLYVVESTVKDSYWPTNGIQKTEWTLWLQQARAAGYNVVWLPLDNTHRAKFNSAAAIARFQELEGFDYGYHNMLFGWIDTYNQNYPCIPPDFNQCLQFQHVEVLFGVIEKAAPAVTELLFNQAMNLRLGTKGLNLVQILMKANMSGIDPQAMATWPELDTYVYNTTRNGVVAQGPAMVCCVFVCNMWKAGGLFTDIDNDFNCAELTNWDDYVLKMFNTTYRPDACITADPHNQQCQLAGKYTLNLIDTNEKVPYKHMAETCASEAPSYNKSATC